MARPARLLRRLIPSSALCALLLACGKAELSAGLHDPEHACAGLDVSPVSAAFADDRVWVVSSDGRLVSFDRGFTSYRDYPALTPIYRVVAGGDGALYALDAVDDSVRVHRLGANGHEHRGFPITLPKSSAVTTATTTDGIAIVDHDKIVYVHADATVREKDGWTGPNAGAQRLHAAWTSDERLHVGAWSERGGGILSFRPDGGPTPQPFGFFDGHGQVFDLIRDPAHPKCVLVGYADYERKNRVARSCAHSFVSLGGELPNQVTSLVARGDSVVAIDARYVATSVEPARVVPHGKLRRQPRCGVVVAELDEAWVFANHATRLPNEPRTDLVVMKP